MGTIHELAVIIAKIIRSDRWVFMVVDGEMGEGKSCFSDQLTREVATELGTNFNLNRNMIYVRSDLKEAIDGDKDGKGRFPERSVIHADEIVSMFFKRNWYDSAQISGIELLNKCRDRHLFVVGNIPHFWDLDSAIYPLVTFRAYIPRRGTALIFKKSDNPFTTDKWNRRINEKRIEKRKGLEQLEGFVTGITYRDWTPAERKKYYAVRNEKRKNTEAQRERNEKYAQIKGQRDEMIRYLLSLKDGRKRSLVTQKLVSELTGLEESMISYIKNGAR